MQLTVSFFQWINGIQVADHKIGHLPFEAEISQQIKFGQENRITVLVGKLKNRLNRFIIQFLICSRIILWAEKYNHAFVI